MLTIVEYKVVVSMGPSTLHLVQDTLDYLLLGEGLILLVQGVVNPHQGVTSNFHQRGQLNLGKGVSFLNIIFLAKNRLDVEGQ